MLLTQSFNSALIRSATYKPNLAALTIYFTTGRQTALFAVPLAVAAGMFALDDPTDFWELCIDGKFPTLGVSWLSMLQRKPAISSVDIKKHKFGEWWRVVPEEAGDQCADHIHFETY